MRAEYNKHRISLEFTEGEGGGTSFTKARECGRVRFPIETARGYGRLLRAPVHVEYLCRLSSSLPRRIKMDVGLFVARRL